MQHLCILWAYLLLSLAFPLIYLLTFTLFIEVHLIFSKLYHPATDSYSWYQFFLNIFSWILGYALLPWLIIYHFSSKFLERHYLSAPSNQGLLMRCLIMQSISHPKHTKNHAYYSNPIESYLTIPHIFCSPYNTMDSILIISIDF